MYLNVVIFHHIFSSNSEKGGSRDFQLLGNACWEMCYVSFEWVDWTLDSTFSQRNISSSETLRTSSEVQ